VKRQAFTAGLVIAALLGVAGCVVETVSAPAPGVAVVGPPPPPMVESRTPPPVGRVVWVAGYWHWTGMQYTWIPGHWEVPRAGVVWRPPRYVQRDGTYFYEPGGWSQR
jgi:WXXGXW repeat (2 copies)